MGIKLSLPCISRLLREEIHDRKFSKTLIAGAQDGHENAK
jgi:hypothetical protein